MDTDRDSRERQSAAASASLALQGDWSVALLEQTLAGIYLIQDGRFRYVNQEFANIFGYASPAEIIDTLKISELIAPEEREKVAENIRRRSEGEVKEMRYSFVGLRRDGRRIHVEVHGRAMQFNGKPAVIGLSLDVTARKLAEAAADEKLRAVGQLAAGVAHEINNPAGFVKSNLGTLQTYLSALLGVADAYEAALSGTPADHPGMQRIREVEKAFDYAYIREDAPRLLQESLEGIERVKRIVANLRDFSQAGEADWQLADLHQCLDSTLSVLADELKRKADIVKDYGQLPPVRCMPFQLNQVFMNLLANAAQSIPEHGTITLRTRRADETVWIEIEDTGIGVAPEIQARIFEPFFTTRPVGKGTGLGLAVSYGIVRNHQGEISVRSAPGKGAIFRVTLPIDPPTIRSGS